MVFEEGSTAVEAAGVQNLATMNMHLPTDAAATLRGQLVFCLERAHHLVQQALQHGADHPLPPPSTLRLAPDMLHLVHQVEVLTQGVTGALALLSGQALAFPHTVFNRGEELLPAMNGVDWPGLDQRLGAALETCRASLGGGEWLPDAATVLVQREGDVRRFRAGRFLKDYAVPNAWFHLCMTYAILRAHGVPLGKPDFEGAPAYVRVEGLRP